MTDFATRRTVLLALAAAPLASIPLAAAVELLDKAPGEAPLSPAAQLARLEQESGGHLGVAALNTADGREITHRGDERFPLCSTFKLMCAGAVLAQEPSLLKKRIHFTQSDMVPHAPITSKHLDDGMTVEELCAATIQYSDNPAANLLMRQIGGPAAVTAFARSIGDDTFRLDRWETELNSAIPGDARDTTTPASMLQSLHKLTLGPALSADKRKILTDWLLGNTTGATRIAAGVPPGWAVADKTGAGAYGTVNDVALIWPPGRPPIVLSVYLTQPGKDDKIRPETLGAVAKIVIEAFKVG